MPKEPTRREAQVLVRMDLPLYRRLRREAKFEGVTIPEVVRQYLNRYLPRNNG